MRSMNGISRRTLMKSGVMLLATPAVLRFTRAYADEPVLKIGHVSPRTGSLAGFAEADDYILDGIAKSLANGIENNGRAWKIEIVSKDSQSNPNRAAEVAADLILKDEVDIIVAASTPDTVNPVSDQAGSQRHALHYDRLPLAALLLRPQRQSRRRLREHLPLLLGSGGRRRRVSGALGQSERREERRRPVSERCRRQCLGRPGARLSQAPGRGWLRTRRSPAATSPRTTTSALRSPPSRPQAPRSSPET
jgi:hypothetical protein